VWDHPLVVDGFDPSTHGFLHVTVAGSDKYGDVVIRFTSIPLDQVINTAGKSLKGNFDLYNVDGNVQGNISLTIAVFGDDGNQEVKGRSVIDSLYHQRLKQMIEASRQLRSGDIYNEGEQFGGMSTETLAISRMVIPLKCDRTLSRFLLFVMITGPQLSFQIHARHACALEDEVRLLCSNSAEHNGQLYRPPNKNELYLHSALGQTNCMPALP
jgi:hypothetical protein